MRQSRGDDHDGHACACCGRVEFSTPLFRTSRVMQSTRGSRQDNGRDLRMLRVVACPPQLSCLCGEGTPSQLAALQQHPSLCVDLIQPTKHQQQTIPHHAPIIPRARPDNLRTYLLMVFERKSRNQIQNLSALETQNGLHGLKTVFPYDVRMSLT